MANTKKGSKKSSSDKPTPRRLKIAGRVDHLLECQRRIVNRSADVASFTAQKLTEGDLKYANWAAQYSEMWSAYAKDLDDISTLPRTPSPRRARREDATSGAGRGDAYANGLALHESFLRRVATYFDGVGALAASGSFEPRKWLENYALFWNHVLTDTSDWVHHEAGAALRPTAEWLPRVYKKVKHGRSDVAFVDIEVSTDALPTDDQTEATLTIGALIKGTPKTRARSPAGLSRLGGGIVLEMLKNVDFVPRTVTQSDPTSQLKLFNLPQLREGDVYVGLVSVLWDDNRTRHPVALVEVEVT